MGLPTGTVNDWTQLAVAIGVIFTTILSIVTAILSFLGRREAKQALKDAVTKTIEVNEAIKHEIKEDLRTNTEMTSKSLAKCEEIKDAMVQLPVSVVNVTTGPAQKEESKEDSKQ